jgi:molybdenum cofactor synthesis domain-containing protein
MTNPTPNPTAAILIIGNEILSGRTQDVNINFIAKKLAGLGIVLAEVRVVPDIRTRIIDAVNALRASYDQVFTTGGIGPTHDDITSECIAEAFGVPWEIHPETYAAMEEKIGRDNFNAARQRMATLPRGAEPIKNKASMAPGFSIGNVHVMAGVPRIMQAMMEALEEVLPRGAPIAMRAVYGIGVLEGEIAAGLTAIQNRYPGLDLGSYPFRQPEGGWGVAIVAKGIDVPAIEQAVAEATALIASLGIKPVQGEPA